MFTLGPNLAFVSYRMYDLKHVQTFWLSDWSQSCNYEILDDISNSLPTPYSNFQQRVLEYDTHDLKSRISKISKLLQIEGYKQGDLSRRSSFIFSFNLGTFLPCTILDAASWGNVAADRDENGRHRRNLITEARGDLFFFSKEGQKRSAKRLLQRGAERVLQQTNSEIISATVYFQQFWRNVFM